MSSLEVHNNQSVEYNTYVHFAYNVGKFLIQKCDSESCDEKHVVSWYIEQFNRLFPQNESSLKKLTKLYGSLIDNLIHDECVTVVNEDSGSRIIKRNPEFFVWAWRNSAKIYEHNKLKY